MTPQQYLQSNDLWDLERLKKHAQDNFVYVIESVRFPGLVMLHYVDACQYNNMWTPFSRLSRGLILDMKNQKVLAYPFDKFFNLGQMDETRYDKLEAFGRFETSEKLDGCFQGNTLINLWDGGTIQIKDIVNNKLTPLVVGRNKHGEIVPSQVINHFNHGRKKDWLKLTILRGKKSTRSLIVTPNHSLYINNEWTLAFNAKEGDKMVSFEKSPDLKTLHFIESSLLGDGYLGANTGSGTYYREGHSEKQNEYNEYLARRLGECFRQFYKRISGFGSLMTDVNSKSYIALDTLRKKWYPKGKKVVPKDLSWMDDFTVAKWYMDDGSLSHHEDQNDRAVFSTNGFTKDDVNRLGNRLTFMYGVDYTVYYSKGWNLRLNYKKDTIRNFWDHIDPYIIPCMRYKLPKEYRETHGYVPTSHIGKECTIPLEATVIKVQKNLLSTKSNGIVAYDIQTETGNYMCKSVLVHNSMIIMFRDPNTNKLTLTTKGSFDSEHGAYANALPFTSQFLVNAERYTNRGTLVFELITKQFQIVVDYRIKGYKEGLYLIGYRDHITGKLATFSEVAKIAGMLGVSTFKTYSFDSLDKLIATVKDLPVLEEGFVLRYPNDLMVKVKGEAYLAAHRFISHLSDRHILEAVGEGTAAALSVLAPDEYHDSVVDKIIFFEKRVAEIESICYTLYSGAPKDGPRKDFALWVIGNAPLHLKGFLFQLMDHKTLDKKHICRVIEEIDNVDGKTRI